jgi:hypothetical protein
MGSNPQTGATNILSSFSTKLYTWLKPRSQIRKCRRAASVSPKNRNIGRRPSGGSDYRTAAAENFAHRAGAFEF